MQLRKQTTVAMAATVAWLGLGMAAAPALAGPAETPYATIGRVQPAAHVTYKVLRATTIRSGPAAKYPKIGLLKPPVKVVGTGVVRPGWIQIKARGNKTGWVAAKDLQAIKPVVWVTPAAYRIAAAHGVNLREGPGMHYRTVGSVKPAGTLVSTRHQRVAGWVQVSTSDGKRGWVATKYVRRTTLPVFQVIAKPGVNLRTGPGVRFKQVRLLKTGITVAGTGKYSGAWAQLSLSSGTIAWAPLPSLRRIGPAPKVGAAPGPAAPAPAPPAPAPPATPESADPPHEMPAEGPADLEQTEVPEEAAPVQPLDDAEASQQEAPAEPQG
jgi:uncharacterized protein YgiM (DUF1202 family)